MSDLLLFQGPDGGEIQYDAGQVALDNTPFTSVYTSLFGGNLEDNGTTATLAKQYWANWDEPDLTRHLRSRTQAILIGLPAISANTQRVQEAALQDLAWMLQDLADSVEVTVTIPARNTVRIQVDIEGRDGTPWNFDFEQPWPGSQ